MSDKEEFAGFENNYAIHHVTQQLASQDNESLLDQEKAQIDLKDRFSYKAFNDLMVKSQMQDER